jgi:hypothetical protein
VRTLALAPLTAVLLGVLGGALRADPPAADKAPLLRWPEKREAEGRVFGGSDFVALTPAPVVGDGPFSVAVWVNAADLAGGDPTYGRGIARSTRGDKLGDWFLAVHPDGRVRFGNWRKDGEDPKGSHVSRDPVVVPEAWTHLAAVWDGKAHTLFVNGVEIPHDARTTATGWETGHEVGRSWTGAGYFWDGSIDDLCVYRRALSAAEVAEAFKADPHLKAATAAAPAGDPKVSQALDRLILARLADSKTTPAPQADDAEFLRRVTLDLVGRIPTPAETEAFLADTAADKRPRLVEALLAGKEWPAAWAQVLAGWLMPKEGRRDPQFVGYLRNGLARNKSWDAFAREMLVARPESTDDRAASLFLGYRKAALQDRSIARDVGRAFFGVNLRCAQCHDHPHVPEWTQERFYGLSAFFGRTFEHAYTEGTQQRTAFGERATGELEYTVKGQKKVAPLVFLDGTAVAEPPLAADFKEVPPPKNALPPDPPFSRRAALARVGVGPKSPSFTRAIVNRVWKRLVGRGLVEPVDMMHEGNPPTHPELLDLLADDFAAHGCDLRRLIAVIVQSETYGRSSRWPGKDGPPKETLYAVAILKPLDADQLALSLPLATGYYDPQLTAKRTMAQLRAVPWKEVLAEFDADGDEFEPTTAQALFLTNSPFVQTNFLEKSNLAAALAALPEDADVARKAYLAVLSRPPTAGETARVARHLKERGPRARGDACRELVWALVSGAEFRFNH